MSVFALTVLEFGLVIVLGFLGAWLLKKIHVPQVLGFILSGLIIGIFNQHVSEFIPLLPFSIANLMQPLATLALGIIGFNIGSELRWDELKKVNRKHFAILIADSIGTFVIVSTLVYFLTPLSFNFALILGALASATAPAATADVLWEYKSAGPLTQAVLFILAIDDIISIFLVQITTSITKVKVAGEAVNVGPILGGFFAGIGISFGIGIILGLSIVWVINKVKDHGEVLELLIGSLVLAIGLAIYLETIIPVMISPILVTMVFGIIIASLSKDNTDRVFHDIFKVGSPIISVFFVVVGLNMRLTDFLLIGVTGVVYLVGRTLGKVGAVGLTARIVKAPKEIQRYLGLCLFSQAGVALGLAATIYNEFQGTTIEAAGEAALIFSTITGTILIVQIIGPLLVKWGIHRAGEVGGKIEQLHVAEATLRKSKIPKIVKEMEKNGLSESEDSSNPENYSREDEEQETSNKMES